MKQFFFVFLMGFVTCTYAQVEFNNKFKGIPPVNIKPKEKKSVPPPVDTSTIIPPNVYKNPNVQSPPNPVTDYRPKVKSEISMIPTDEFINPGDEVRDKLAKDMDRRLIKEGLKEDTRYLVKKDVSFGEIRTKSAYFVIKCRDYGAIDGDFIQGILDQKVVRGALELQAYFKEFTIYFHDGINVFELEALNRGSLGGNTGEFYIYDAAGKLIIHEYWDNWDAGVKGKFVIVKE
ncbi:hypothetical protein [Flavobacterium gilvum]|uniref:Uncharacterized protein n=1 Tax=Flavobacterium gilvum TaxID=1492737 RepID=A0AAC9I2R3_9FLAO|nr:hypothetical protein [Flavobacterium gilvum]AOW09639.1 hypothetical protein EM308_09055 [Flavobacterium gilvum]KFC59645.1 hypothetical protein FEM08_15900 [Flavobacterium gilvum]